MLGASVGGTHDVASSDRPSGAQYGSISDGNGNRLGSDRFPTSRTCSGWTGATGGGSTGGDTTCTDTWANDAQAFSSVNGRRCHAWAGTWSAVKASTRPRTRIASGSMPRGTSLSSSERARILAWIDCGQN